MELEKVRQELNRFINDGTEQKFLVDYKINYSNEYINVVVVKTSNKSGGATFPRGKQWGIIIETYKDFTCLLNWERLKEEFGDDLKITKGRNEHSDKNAIRIYRMSLNPNEKILKLFLDFIFEK